MRNSRLWLRPLRSFSFALLLATLLPWACTRKTVSFNSNPEQTAAVLASDTLTRTADTLKGSPSLSTARKVVTTKEQERAAKEAEKEAQRKPAKKKKVFLGEKIKKAYAKAGPKGKNQFIEVFYFLKYPLPLNTYAPAHYYYDTKKHKILKLAAIEEDLASLKILHGPYKKLQNNKVIETGYYDLGTRHLRWERFDRNGVLLSKIHYEMGFPRDANVSYYGEDRSLINEVVPYVNGKLEGDYAKFLINGQADWRGQFENLRSASARSVTVKSIVWASLVSTLLTLVASSMRSWICRMLVSPSAITSNRNRDTRPKPRPSRLAMVKFKNFMLPP